MRRMGRMGVGRQRDSCDGGRNAAGREGRPARAALALDPLGQALDIQQKENEGKKRTLTVLTVLDLYCPPGTAVASGP